MNELVDIQIFLINLLIAEDISTEKFEELLKIKQTKNVLRQHNGY
jgi:hypothetical protein